MTARSTCQPTLEKNEKGDQKIMFVAKKYRKITHTHTKEKTQDIQQIKCRKKSQMSSGTINELNRNKDEFACFE